jgi:hypothetical protein
MNYLKVKCATSMISIKAGSRAAYIRRITPPLMGCALPCILSVRVWKNLFKNPLMARLRVGFSIYWSADAEGKYKRRKSTARPMTAQITEIRQSATKEAIVAELGIGNPQVL